jgi:uncharacterized membrane protein
LSLVPFVTAWAGENHFAPVPTALYGVVLFMAGVAYYLLSRAIISAEGPHSLLRKAIGEDRKGLASEVLYLAAIALAFVAPWASALLYVAVAGLWLIPDRRIERALAQEEDQA